MKILLIHLALLCNACMAYVPERRAEDHAQAKQLIAQGVQHLRTRNLKEAEATFELAHEIAPTALTYDALGCLAFLKDDLALAEQLFIVAVKKDPSYLSASANLALLYDYIGETKLAEKLYLEVLKKNPTNYKLRNNFAAFTYDNYNSSRIKVLVKAELLKAKSINPDIIIKGNLKRLE